jgi:hypothetical protein
LTTEKSIIFYWFNLCFYHFPTFLFYLKLKQIFPQNIMIIWEHYFNLLFLFTCTILQEIRINDRVYWCNIFPLLRYIFKRKWNKRVILIERWMIDFIQHKHTMLKLNYPLYIYFYFRGWFCFNYIPQFSYSKRNIIVILNSHLPSAIQAISNLIYFPS